MIDLYDLQPDPRDLGKTQKKTPPREGSRGG